MKFIALFFSTSIMPSSFGLAFLGISAFLYTARYLCAAMLCAGFSSGSAELFNSAYTYVGPHLTILSFLSFLMGVGVLFQDYLAKFNRLWNDEFGDPEESSKQR